MIQKYIKFDRRGFVIWTTKSDMQHSDVAKSSQENGAGSVLSAGFVTFIGGVRCFGRSESLNIDSALTDGDELAAQLGLRITQPTKPTHHV